jgi:glutamyl-tRNA synthetase
MSPTLQDSREGIRRVALENAVQHGGAARWETVLNKVLSVFPDLRVEAGETAKVVRELVQEVNALPAEEKSRQMALIPTSPTTSRTEGAPETGATAEMPKKQELPPLPGAEMGKVRLRMAPFPSGALHIGSARGIYLNDAYRKMYDGEFYLVYDDTVGSAEKRPFLEAYDLIREDLEAAGIKPDKYIYKSDRMDLYYRHLPPMLEKGAAYVCLCPAETLRKNREAGASCPERERPVEWQMEMWDKMLSGGYREGEAVVRLKTDMKDPNPAFRDRVLFRISEFEHPRVGNKYRVWPMLEFAFAIDDVELGITHVLRGKDLVMEDLMEEAIWKVLGMKGPYLIHWGLLRLRDAKISKSKSYQEVRNGIYDGWSDPRTWSFSSLARRGIRAEAIRNFVLSFGMSLADIEVPAESLYSENRKLIDPVTPRRAFVPDPRLVRVDGFPADLESVELSNHPSVPDLGTRVVALGKGGFFMPGKDVEKHLGKEIRLKDLINVQLPTLPPGAHQELTAQFTTKLNKTIPRIQWVPEEGAVPVSILMVEGQRMEGMGEPCLATVEEGEIYQFERFGFVRADKQEGSGPRRFVFGHF